MTVEQYPMKKFRHFYGEIRKQFRRFCRKIIIETSGSFSNLNPEKQTCIVVAHDLSQTGCPIMTWNMIKILHERYNVISIALKYGPLESDFKSVSDVCIILSKISIRHEKWGLFRLNRILKNVHIDFSIVNSIKSQKILPLFVNLHIPSLLFIHEFAYYLSKDELRSGFLLASEVIYSAQVVLDASLHKLGISHTFPIIAQGKSESPSKSQTVSPDELQRIEWLTQQKTEHGETIILAAGLIQYRKGVDLFIRAAGRIKKASPAQKIRFVWAGELSPLKKENLSGLLEFQIEQFGLKDCFNFIGHISDIDKIYALSDMLLLTSILDPLPGTVIEAMSHKLPVICFEGCSGFPEIFRNAGLNDLCVAEYLDVEDMAQKAAALLTNPVLYENISSQMFTIAQHNFDMRRYVDDVLNMVPQVKKRLEQEEQTIARQIEEHGTKNISFLEHMKALRTARLGLDWEV